METTIYESMKIIDLLNMIANGEKMPKSIKFDGLIYDYDELYSDYMLDTGEMRISLLEQHNDNLNLFLQEEVIVMPQMKVYLKGTSWLPKELEKLDTRLEQNIKGNYRWVVYNEGNKYTMSTPQKIIANKLNEVIDYINSQK